VTEKGATSDGLLPKRTGILIILKCGVSALPGGGTGSAGKLPKKENFFGIVEKAWQSEERKFLSSGGRHGQQGIWQYPGPLFANFRFLASAVPVRFFPTFLALLIGARLTQTGFITGAWLAINPLRSWSGCCKWLQEGRFIQKKLVGKSGKII